jgi:Family of unknown function (DUF6445)
MIKMNEAAEFQWCTFGNGSEVLVIDNALEEPQRIRDFAWTRRFHLPAQAEYYPGWRAPAELPGEIPFLRDIGSRFLDRLWPNGWPATVTMDAAKPKSAFSIFAIDEKVAAEHSFIDQHYDTAYWIAVVTYLFDERPENAGKRGTAFWKHKGTELETFFTGDPLQAVRNEQLFGMRLIEPLRAAIKTIRSPSLEHARKALLHAKQSRRRFSLEEDENWELTKFVEAKFNRTIAYPTWQIHSVIDTVGASNLSKANARLTLNTFVPYPLPASMTPPMLYTGPGYTTVDGMVVD